MFTALQRGARRSSGLETPGPPAAWSRPWGAELHKRGHRGLALCDEQVSGPSGTRALPGARKGGGGRAVPRGLSAHESACVRGRRSPVMLSAGGADEIRQHIRDAWRRGIWRSIAEDCC